jgi:hypothetical protein
MKRRILTIGSILLLALLLAGAASVGGRLLNGQGLMGGPDEAQDRNDKLPASELPQTPADIWGVFVRRENNSFFVGTGNAMAGVRIDRSGNAEAASDYDGPVVEVVVTSQTIIYNDVTMRQYDRLPPEGQQIQQVVEPGSLDDIGESSTIAVWGTQTGDRIIAEVLVYESPALIEKP